MSLTKQIVDLIKDINDEERIKPEILSISKEILSILNLEIKNKLFDGFNDNFELLDNGKIFFDLKIEVVDGVDESYISISGPPTEKMQEEIFALAEKIMKGIIN